MPESISSCGLLIAPPQSRPRRRRAPCARRRRAGRSRRWRGRPRARSASRRRRCARSRLGRVPRRAGGRRRRPTSGGPSCRSPGRGPAPSCSAPLKSSVALEPGATARLDERVAQLVGVAAVLDVQRAVLAVVRRRRAGCCPRPCLKYGQHVVVAPAGRAVLRRARRRSRRGCRGCRSSRSSTSSRRAPSSAASRRGGRAAASARWSCSSSPTGLEQRRERRRDR